jgi:hypothetical protein
LHYYFRFVGVCFDMPREQVFTHAMDCFELYFDSEANGRDETPQGRRQKQRRSLSFGDAVEGGAKAQNAPAAVSLSASGGFRRTTADEVRARPTGIRPTGGASSSSLAAVSNEGGKLLSRQSPQRATSPRSATLPASTRAALTAPKPRTKAPAPPLPSATARVDDSDDDDDDDDDANTIITTTTTSTSGRSSKHTTDDDTDGQNDDDSNDAAPLPPPHHHESSKLDTKATPTTDASSVRINVEAATAATTATTTPTTTPKSPRRSLKSPRIKSPRKSKALKSPRRAKSPQAESTSSIASSSSSPQTKSSRSRKPRARTANADLLATPSPRDDPPAVVEPAHSAPVVDDTGWDIV